MKRQLSSVSVKVRKLPGLCGTKSGCRVNRTVWLIDLNHQSLMRPVVDQLDRAPRLNVVAVFPSYEYMQLSLMFITGTLDVGTMECNYISIIDY